MCTTKAQISYIFAQEIRAFVLCCLVSNNYANRFGQTVQTQIRLLLEEQSEQGLPCLLFHLHHFDKIPKGLASLFEFYVDYSKVFGNPKI